MKILVLGSGGREHAIAWALAKSPRTEALFVAPGNGGTDGIALAAGGASQNVDLDPMDAEAVRAFAQDNGVGLVVIGAEAPLAVVLARPGRGPRHRLGRLRELRGHHVRRAYR